MSAPATGRGAAVRFPFPPLLFAGPLVAALLLHWVVPWSVGGGAVITFIGIGLVVVGLLAVASGVAAVVREGTTVVPHRRVSQLVTRGPYRVSRNPMYTGLALAHAGAALWVGSWWPLLVLPLCLLATSRLVIRPEETYLADRFGEAYAQYRAQVRRWL